MSKDLRYYGIQKDPKKQYKYVSRTTKHSIKRDPQMVIRNQMNLVFAFIIAVFIEILLMVFIFYPFFLTIILTFIVFIIQWIRIGNSTIETHHSQEYSASPNIIQCPSCKKLNINNRSYCVFCGNSFEWCPIMGTSQLHNARR